MVMSLSVEGLGELSHSDRWSELACRTEAQAFSLAGVVVRMHFRSHPFREVSLCAFYWLKIRRDFANRSGLR